ncbi:hypothetical protein V6N11_008789 [Hibiscus sabdariffa]|uniref:RNase H type-1 domain-containing protein n=2 Tax=Hibiscus sabdariffa TaxID=183260 RepID=A0ABR2NQM4_9ROSI
MWNPPLTCLLTKLGQLDTNILVVQLVVTTVAPVKSVAAVGVCSPIKVELWASHDGLVQAWVLGKTHVAMEVDSTLVMREANVVADKLAKSIVLGSLEFQVFVDPPPFILEFL